MNLGAKESTGDILFFLHSDSELPKRPLEEIKAVIKDHEAGCFGIAFHSRQFFMWTCRVISNHRIKDRKVMFGDRSGDFYHKRTVLQSGDVSGSSDYGRLPVFAYVKGNGSKAWHC